MQNTELPEKIEPTSLNFQTELAAQLAELVPEALSDGKLDVAKLREMVNGDAENSPEKFGLFWPGKRAAQTLAQIPTTATLIPAPEESVDWGDTKNLFIEGDNLEVLKALQNTYRRKVKMIYIDPPYNTGKEFIYPDKFSEGLQGYLEYTGQKNEAGENIESKPETGGRRHSNWLSMMYPRLQLAKSLLAEDGVIFISIDENEQTNLKHLCDEVFGEDNFIAVIVVNRPSEIASGNVVSKHEYMICYARKIENFKVEGVPKFTISRGTVGNKDQTMPEITFPAGLRCYGIDDGTYTTTRKIEGSSENITNLDPIIVKNGKLAQPVRMVAKWRSSNDMRNFFTNNCQPTPAKINGIIVEIYFENTKFNPQIKKATFEKINSLITSNTRGSKDLESLGLVSYFDNPKSVSLIKNILATVSNKNSIILDFFSGSGTTAHATMQLNAEDGGSRVHIQVQLPELTDTKSEAYKGGYENIAKISEERIRRAGKKIREDYADKIAQRSTPFDTGFRVYKLAPSNFVQWDENRAKNDIQQSVLDFAANKKPDAAPGSLLTEIMLQARMPLSANIEKRELQSGSWVYIVDSGNLIAYVANEQITEAQANEIADLAPAKLIVLDSAFNGNNALKINVANICKEKFIKEFKTI